MGRWKPKTDRAQYGSQLNFRVSTELREITQAAAELEGMAESEWIRKVLKRAGRRAIRKHERAGGHANYS